MMDARSRQRGMMGNPDTAQLLLIVSDGRGLFMEGMETVKSAVRQARESNIFLVFVVIDNPQAKVFYTFTSLTNSTKLFLGHINKVLQSL